MAVTGELGGFGVPAGESGPPSASWMEAWPGLSACSSDRERFKIMSNFGEFYTYSEAELMALSNEPPPGCPGSPGYLSPALAIDRADRAAYEAKMAAAAIEPRAPSVPDPAVLTNPPAAADNTRTTLYLGIVAVVIGLVSLLLILRGE